MSQLRKIVRETLREEAWPPGKWIPSVDPIDDDEVDAMSTGGLGVEDEDLPRRKRIKTDGER